MSYFDQLAAAMALVSRNPKAVFIGQGCGCQGTGMSGSFKDVPEVQRIEFPVAEDLQLGMSIGMALEGFLPVSVFPRFNFLLCAGNQLVNHLDRLPIYSKGGYNPKVLIRVAIPSTHPFNPQSQHDDDFTAAFSWMLRWVHIEVLETAATIVPLYQQALDREGSTILVEKSALYRTE